MTGWQRVFILFILCVGVLIFWPQYDWAGLSFLGLAFVFWTCIIILLSIMINIFAIYKLAFLHRLISLILIVAMAFTLLAYFPLKGQDTPLARLQRNVWPTLQDARAGLKRLTFNFDFVRRRADQEANFVNQQLDSTTQKTQHQSQELTKKLKEQKEKLDIIVEGFQENKEEK